MAKKKNKFKQTKNPRLNKAINEIQKNSNGNVISLFNLLTMEDEIEEYDSLDGIFKDIKERVHYGVDWASRYCYEVLGVAVEHWYNDAYDPGDPPKIPPRPLVYIRSETLYNAPSVWVSGYGGHISFGDYPSMTIWNGDRDIPNSGEDILFFAEQGIHGATDGWQISGEKEIGIWGEFIDYLENGTWSYTTGGGQIMSSELDEAPMVDLAFHAGISVKAYASFGRK